MLLVYYLMLAVCYTIRSEQGIAAAYMANAVIKYADAIHHGVDPRSLEFEAEQVNDEVIE